MAESQCLCKVATDDNKDYYLLTSESQYRGELETFDITLSDGNKAWTGQVSNEDLEQFSENVHMDYEDMVTQTRRALTNDTTGNIDFLYQVKISGSSVKFVWKKQVTTEDIKFQLGSTDLRQQNNATTIIKQIFAHAITTVGNLHAEIKSLQSDNERLVSERAGALKRLDKYVKAKEDIEQELYSKFVAVLNDKKSKLRELRDENEALQANGSVDPTPDNGRPGPSRSRDRQTVQSEGSDTDDSVGVAADSKVKVKQDYDSEYGTDDEERETRAPPLKKSRRVMDESLDTSGELMLGGSPEEEECRATGRRRRQRAGCSKKQTPSRPTIPKMPSSDQKAGSSKQRSSRSSMRHSTSIHSKSSDNIDADELLDDF